MTKTVRIQDQAAWARENWPEETAHILRVAQEVCRNYFLFDLPWDMERTYEPVVFHGEIDWEYQPGEDPEFVYQMNRHRYFICLGQAYGLTGEEKYAECFVGLLRDWIRRVKLTTESAQTTWRTIEAGLRGEYWTKAFRLFEGSPCITREIRQEYLDSLREHGEYLCGSFTGFKYSSNWGVLESHGLYLIGTELGEEHYCHTALERLALEAEIQILPDGVHWEQSSMYHNEVMSCYLEVLREQNARGRKLSETVLDAVEKMALANLAWVKPDHSQPLYGDSDQTDIRDILTRSAWLLSVGGRTRAACLLKAGGYPKMDFEGCFDFGPDAVKAYAQLPETVPELNTAGLDDSGNYFMRSGPGEKADYLHFRNGSHGGGHGHSDKLHLSLVWEGEDVLTDAGRYTYVDGPDREWFKSAFAHNTILVDGKDHVICKGSWETVGGAPEIRFPIQNRDGYVLFEGAHTGYISETPEEKNVYLNRKVLALEEGLILVLDTAVTGEKHEYTRFFHLKEKNGLTTAEDGIHYQGENVTGRIWIDTASETKQIPSRWSRHYNEYSENTCLAAYTGGKGLTVMAAVFSRGEEQLLVEEKAVWSRVPEKYLDDACAAAWNIRRGERSYDVILRKQDVGGAVVLLQSGTCMGIGRVMAARQGEKTAVFY